MFISKRREPSSIFVTDQESLGPELIEHSVHIDAVPEHDDVCCQAESPELIFLSFMIPLLQFVLMSVENDPRKRMAAFAAIQLCKYTSPLVFIINIVKQIQGFDDPLQLLEREG